jgi:outer membrane cobalamin receptor
MRRSLVASSALAALALSASAARADDLESLLEERVVSTASKALETTTAAPATSTVITADDLRRYGVRTLGEAINFLGMGMVVENSLTDLEIGARGAHFTQDYGNHVLLLVNGHAMNEQWGGTAYFDRGAAIPFELIDHIEVILGPGSVLYGSEAMLGVINIVTKRAKDYDGIHAVVESELATSIRVAAGFGHEFKLFGKKGEVTGEIEYFAQNGPAFTLAPETQQDVRVNIGGPPNDTWGGALTKANYAQIPAGYVRVMLGDFELDLRSAIDHRAEPMNAYTFDDPDSYETDRWLSADVKHKWVLSESVDLASRLYADSYDYVEQLRIADPGSCVGGMPHGCSYVLVGASKWMGLEEQLTIDWKKDGSIFTLVGVDGRLKRIGSKTDYFELETNRTPGSFGVTEETEKALGVYGEQILRPWKPLALNAGVRLDVDDRFGAHASPRATVAVSPWDGGTLKAIYAEAFRAPTTYERSYADPISQLSAPNLGPETVQSIEASFDQRFLGQHVHVDAFRTEFNSLVVDTELSPAEVKAAVAAGELGPTASYAEQYRNVATVLTWGFDLGLEGVALSSRLRYGATFTGANARQNGTGEIGADAPLSVAPNYSGNARVAYDLGGYLPTVALATHFIGRRAADTAYQGNGFVVEPFGPVWVELRATLSGAVPKVRGLSYRATANVVTTDAAPYVVGPSMLANGRAQLMPVDRFRTGVGLSYDLPL